ncbi:MAG TPA: tetratricopeptide repeat protein [Gemmataceae bacterium]|nr:tetratricopeptide repeat protein [Gemmataceae bacterium]
MRIAWGFLASVSLILGLAIQTRADDTPAELLKQAQQALQSGNSNQALALAGKVIAADARCTQAFEFRGKLYGSRGRHAEAVADFTKALEIEPKLAEVYNLRGAEHFKLGHIAESIKDFDKYLEYKPEETPGHWMRGISYYYAGRFAEGRKQFAAYEKVDDNDVENAVWHYLCNARAVGPAKAQGEMLKIGRDRRVPMMEVYDLFKGRIRPDKVMAAATSAKPDERKQALFLAHLYLGLYYDSQGDTKQAHEHMTQAAGAAPAGGYMGDVAKVHLLLQKNAPNQK